MGLTIRAARFDARGNLHDWWTAQDAKNFDNRAQCLVDEYNGFTAVDDVHVNGKLTLGENTADNGGLRLALAAYLATAAAQPDRTIDGFTPEQRLFIGCAQIWCENSRRSDPAARANESHSPGRFRTNGAVSNVPEFAKAFSCKADAPMSRERVSGLVGRMVMAGVQVKPDRPQFMPSRVRDQIVRASAARLRTYCQQIAIEKRRRSATRHTGRGPFGLRRPNARLLIVGLAPAAHGANRAGRVLRRRRRGSGDFLMSALNRAGFANLTTLIVRRRAAAARRFILAAVRCAPPDNKPTPEEIVNCLPHFDAELNARERPRCRRARKNRFDAY
jgi:hypothetical protein